MKLTLPYPPTANLFWRHFRGRVVVSTAARKYRETVKHLCMLDCVQPLTGEVGMSVSVYRPRKAGDLDNTLKVLIDALRGLAYEDDSRIVLINAQRFDDKNNPRAEVYV